MIDIFSLVATLIAEVENASAATLGNTLARLNSRLDMIERGITNHRRAENDRQAELLRRERAIMSDARRFILDSIGRT